MTSQSLAEPTQKSAVWKQYPTMLCSSGIKSNTRNNTKSITSVASATTRFHVAGCNLLKKKKLLWLQDKGSDATNWVARRKNLWCACKRVMTKHVATFCVLNNKKMVVFWLFYHQVLLTKDGYCVSVSKPRRSRNSCCRHFNSGTRVNWQTADQPDKTEITNLFFLLS